MSYHGFPLADEPREKLHSFDFLAQFWLAEQERAWAVGEDHFPKERGVSSGTVTSPSGATFTLGGAGGTALAARWTGSAWTGYGWWNPEHGTASLDAVFPSTDPRKSVRCHISTLAGAQISLDATALANLVKRRLIDSLESLSGQSVQIFQSGSPDWGHRFPEWPIPAVDSSSVSIIGDGTTATVTHAEIAANRLGIGDVVTIQDAVPAEFNGVYTVARTSATTFTFTSSVNATATTQASLHFQMVRGGNIFRWYSGLQGDRYVTAAAAETAYVSDISGMEAAGAPTPAMTVKISQGAEGECDDVVHNVFDTDVWSNDDETCSPPAMCYNPDLYKSIRGLQARAEGICPWFLPADWTGGGDYVPNYTPASMFAAAGINMLSAAVSDVTPWRPAGTTETPTHAGDFDKLATVTTVPGAEVYWSYRGQNGDAGGDRSAATSGGAYGRYSVEAGADGVVTFPLPRHTHPTIGETWPTIVETLAGYQQIDVSRGWTRKYPRVFDYLFDKTVFIPDLEATDDGLVANDPPTDATGYDGVYRTGYWVTRKASTRCSEVADNGFSYPSGPEFYDGLLARYDGDNHAEPAVRRFGGPVMITDNDPPYPPDTGRWAQLVTRNEPASTDTVEAVDQNEDVSGAALSCDLITAGAISPIFVTGMGGWPTGLAHIGSPSIEVDADWWDGVLITHSGVVTTGTSTSLTDTSKDGSLYFALHTRDLYDGAIPEDSPILAMNPLRFIGMALEVQLHPDQWESRIITGGGNTPHANLTWDDPFLETGIVTDGAAGWLTCAGREWEEDEWQGINVLLTVDGVESGLVATVTGNTADTLHFSSGMAALIGVRFTMEIASLAGMNWRVREPAAEMNRWQGRTLHLTSTTGEASSGTITHSTDNRIWFDVDDETPLWLTAGTIASYRIEAPLPGGTWWYQDGEWIKPPTDTINVNTGKNFPDRQIAIVPDEVVGGGKVRRGDYIGRWLLEEIRACQAVRTRTWYNPAWGLKIGDHDHGYATWRSGGGVIEPVGLDWAGLPAGSTGDDFPGLVYDRRGGMDPHVVTEQVRTDTDHTVHFPDMMASYLAVGPGAWSAAVERHAARPTLSGIPTKLERTVKFFGYGNYVASGSRQTASGWPEDEFDGSDLGTAGEPKYTWFDAGGGARDDDGVYWGDLMGSGSNALSTQIMAGKPGLCFVAWQPSITYLNADGVDVGRTYDEETGLELWTEVRIGPLMTYVDPSTGVADPTFPLGKALGQIISDPSATDSSSWTRIAGFFMGSPVDGSTPLDYYPSSLPGSEGWFCTATWTGSDFVPYNLGYHGGPFCDPWEGIVGSHFGEEGYYSSGPDSSFAGPPGEGLCWWNILQGNYQARALAVVDWSMSYVG